jgi:hypothetical protein
MFNGRGDDAVCGSRLAPSGRRFQLLGRLLHVFPLRHIVQFRRHQTPTFLAE